MRKVQEKKEQKGRLAGDFGHEREGEVHERGVVEMGDEKPVERKGIKEEEEKGGDIEVLTTSIRSMSL